MFRKPDNRTFRHSLAASDLHPKGSEQGDSFERRRRLLYFHMDCRQKIDIGCTGSQMPYFTKWMRIDKALANFVSVFTVNHFVQDVVFGGCERGSNKLDLFLLCSDIAECTRLLTSSDMIEKRNDKNESERSKAPEDTLNPYGNNFNF